MGIISAHNRVLVFNIKLHHPISKTRWKPMTRQFWVWWLHQIHRSKSILFAEEEKCFRSCQKEPWQSFPFLHICICQGSNGDDNLAHENVNTCFTFKRPLDSHSHPSICVCQGSIVSWPPIWRPTTQRALCACRQLANTFLAFHFTLTLRTSSSKYACFCHCCKCFKL